MLTKIKDFTDTKVNEVILVENLEHLNVLADVLASINLKRLNYEVYKNVVSGFEYMFEISMPYNRYLAMMKGLQARGYNLAEETKVGIISRMIECK